MNKRKKEGNRNWIELNRNTTLVFCFPCIFCLLYFSIHNNIICNSIIFFSLYYRLAESWLNALSFSLSLIIISVSLLNAFLIWIRLTALLFISHVVTLHFICSTSYNWFFFSSNSQSFCHGKNVFFFLLFYVKKRSIFSSDFSIFLGVIKMYKVLNSDFLWVFFFFFCFK